MKQNQWIAALLLVGAAGFAGCDKGPDANTAELEAPVEAVANNAAEAAGTVAEGNTVATKVEAGAADLADKALAEVAVVDRPLDSAGALCDLTGAAGETVSCTVNLASDEDGIAARALQGTLAYDGKRAALKGFSARVCTPDGTCLDKALTPQSSNIASGHVLKSTPIGTADASGRASFMIVNMSAPQTAISTAKAGSAEAIFNVEFVLSEEVRADSPVKVTLGNVIASDEAANQVAARVDGATILTAGITK